MQVLNGEAVLRLVAEAAEMSVADVQGALARYATSLGCPEMPVVAAVYARAKLQGVPELAAGDPELQRVLEAVDDVNSRRKGGHG